MAAVASVKASKDAQAAAKNPTAANKAKAAASQQDAVDAIDVAGKKIEIAKDLADQYSELKTIDQGLKTVLITVLVALLIIAALVAAIPLLRIVKRTSKAIVNHPLESAPSTSLFSTSEKDDVINWLEHWEKNRSKTKFVRPSANIKNASTKRKSLKKVAKKAVKKNIKAKR